MAIGVPCGGLHGPVCWGSGVSRCGPGAGRRRWPRRRRGAPRKSWSPCAPRHRRPTSQTSQSPGTAWPDEATDRRHERAGNGLTNTALTHNLFISDVYFPEKLQTPGQTANRRVIHDTHNTKCARSHKHSTVACQHLSSKQMPSCSHRTGLLSKARRARCSCVHTAQAELI